MLLTATDSFSDSLRKLKIKAYSEVNMKNPLMKEKFLAMRKALLKNRDKFLQTVDGKEEIWQGLSGAALVVLTRSLKEPKGTIIVKNLTNGEIYEHTGFYPAWLVLSIFYRNNKSRPRLNYDYVPKRQAWRVFKLPAHLLEILNESILCPCCGENVNTYKTKETHKIRS